VKLPPLPRLRLEHLLGAALALFALLALWPWFAPEAGSAPPPGKPAPAQPELSALPPRSAFSAIVDRPLFSPTRRPVPGAATGGKGIETRYQLLGLVVSETVRRAWLADGARHFELGEGDKLDGWTVARIEQDRLVLTSPSGQAVLALRTPAEEPSKEATQKGTPQPGRQ
jgi:hypothetical protein